MLKTVVLYNIFAKTVIIYFQDYKKYIFFNIVKVLTPILKKFSLLNTICKK